MPVLPVTAAKRRSDPPSIACLSAPANVRYLLRFLNIESFDEAVSVIVRYHPLEQYPQKTHYACEELFSLVEKNAVGSRVSACSRWSSYRKVSSW